MKFYKDFFTSLINRTKEISTVSYCARNFDRQNFLFRVVYIVTIIIVTCCFRKNKIDAFIYQGWRKLDFYIKLNVCILYIGHFKFV